MNDVTRILIVEDQLSDYELARREISKSLNNCVFQRAETRENFLKELKDFHPDLILSDYSLPAFDGMQALKLAQKHAPITPLIIWTGSIDEDTAVDCMRAGASNYILKENNKRLAPAILHALEERQLLLGQKQAEEKLRESESRYRALFENMPIAIFEEDFSEVKKYLDRLKKQGITDFRKHFDSHPEEIIECASQIEILHINNAAVQMYHANDKDHLRGTYKRGLGENELEHLKTGLIAIAEGKTSAYWEGKDTKISGDPIVISVYASVVPGHEEDYSRVIVATTNITDRKQAEEKLAERENRFRALIENGMDNISLLAADGVLLWENPAVNRTLGYEQDAFVNRNIFELMHPEDMAWTSELFAKLIQEPGSQQRGTFRLKHKDDTWCWIEATATNMLEEPSVQAIVINYRDITERKIAEDKLRDSEERYRLLFENNPLPMWIFDLESLRFLKVNDAAVQHYGYSQEEFMSMTIADIRPAEDLPKLRETIERITAGLHKSGTWRHCKKDGTIILVDIVSHTVNFAGRSGELILAMDVTERKLAEDQLRRSQQELAEAQRVAKIGSWSFDQDTDTVHWSEELHRIFGIEKKAFNNTYQAFLDCVHPEDRFQVKQMNANALKAGDRFEIEYRIITPTGEIKTISEIGDAIQDKAGNITGLFGTAQDITQRKQAEIERQATLDIMQGLTSTKDLQEFLKLIHQSIGKVILAENFFVAFYHLDTGLFEEIYSVDKYDPPAPPSKLQKSITSYVFRTGEPLLLTQASIEELVAKGEIELVGTKSASWLGVPLKSADGTIGVMAVQDYEDPKRYSEHNKEFLASIASQVALAIERKQADIQLQQKNEDLALLNAINQEVVHGEDLDTIVGLLAQELKRIFSAVGSTIYMFSSDRQTLTMQEYAFSPEIANKIERLIGFAIPKIQIPIKSGDYFHRAMVSKRSILTTEPREIQNWLAEFVETKFLPGFAKAAIRKLIPQIHRLLNIKSTIVVPLISEEEVIGFLDVSSSSIFTAKDLKRIENIGGQLTAVIQRQQANEKIRRSEEFLQSIQNALSASIAILDEEGTIVQVNTAWRRFGEQNGLTHSEHCVGLNYLQICDQASGLYAEEASTVARAIRALIAGEKNESWIEYPCHSPQEKRWFLLHITKFEETDRVWIVLAHENITERKLAEAAEREQRILAETLRDTSQILSSTLDYGEVLDHILTSVERVVTHDGAAIMLLEGSKMHVVRSSGYGERDEYGDLMQLELSLAEIPNMQKMFETGKPVIVPDTRTYPGWKKLPATDWVLSNVGVPISIYGGVIGFITLDSQTPSFFTPVHAERLQAFANQAALAIHNANLLQKAQQEIAERKQVEQELRTSEERFRQLADNIQEVFWMTDAKSGKEIYISPAAEKIWGCSLDTLLYDPDAFLNSVLPEDRPILARAIERERNGERVELEYRITRPDGSMRWIWDRALPIFDDQGNIKMLAGIITDITERKRAEEALHESENKARALLNALPDLMFRLDRDGRIIDYKAELSDLYAQSEQTLIQKNLREIAPIEFADLVQRYVQQTLASERMQIFEFQLPIPERGWHDYEARMVPSGKHEVTAIVRDITERKKAEEALRESEERFSNAFEYAPIGMGMISIEGRFLKVNQALCKLLGYAEQELKTKTFQEITHPEDLETDLNYVQQVLAGEIVSYQMEKRYFHQDGQIVWVLLTVSLVKDEQGNPQYFISQIEDITERKRAEQEIRLRVQETSALLETSLALTNLDLNAILQGIGNAAQNLFAADGCRIFLVQPDGEYLRCVLALQENFIAFSDLKLKIGEGVTGAVAASGQAEIVNEMQNDPRSVLVPGTPDEEEEAVMFAPLKERDRTIGVLSIRRASSERPFTSADLELLEAFASMAASAVSNARLFEETQQRLSELEALYENGLAVGQLREPREIGDRLIETFARYLSWHHVTIRLLDPDTNQLELIAFNLPGLDEEAKLEAERNFNTLINKASQGLSGWAVQTGIPLRTGNVHSHSQYVDTQAGIESGLYMPMKIRDRVIGVISVESEISDAFTEQDERLLATLANQAAVAFENARLYQAAHEELLERTRAQAALWASETHYRELADSITDVLFELDHNLQFTHWNKASEMLTGIPQEDAIGKSLYEIFGESEEQTQLGKIYDSVLVNRQAKTFETELVLRGQKRALEVNVYPSARGVSVVAKDVTERKLDEALLRKRFELMEYSAHHTLEELMQKAIDEVSELTDSHIGFMHFVEEDEQTINMQAWSSETIRMVGNIEEQGNHYPLALAGIWADALRQKQPVIHNDYESMPNKKELPDNHLNVSRELVIPILRDERIVAVIGIGNKPQEYTRHDVEIAERFADYAWDITERKRMESILADERNQLARRVEERTADLSRANSNLARALRVKDEFLANMSHELRTPLNAILGLSESLSEQVAGPLNEKQQKYLNTINESGHHLLSLINDILDLAKIEAGQITLDINKVDINSVCQASLRMIKQLAHKKNQEVEFEIDEGIGLMWADERRLKQMIVNLLSNAVKFTPEGGQLGLEVQGDLAGNRVIITIWDKGIGISELDMDRLFKPFVQLNSGLAREATGTGLGLALVAQMARLHGGSVSVESQLGEGSLFSLHLPWEPALGADASIRLRNTGKFRAIDPRATKKPTILIIEDTREVVMMLEDYLEMYGFRIVTAQDGADGILQAKLSHPNLILMDIMMPGMDGFETTRRLRADPEFKDTPIIALTALAMPNDRQRCLDAGMDEYMSKPVNLKAVTKLIRNILLEKEEGKPK